MNMKVPLELLVLVHVFASTHGYKILGVFSFCAHSHYSLGFRLMKELADRGHNVTFMNCYPRDEKIENFRDVSVKEVAASIGKFIGELEDFGQLSYLGQLQFVLNLGLAYTGGVLEHRNVQDLMNSDEEFDVIVMEHFINDALTIFHHRFKCPIIFLAPGPITMLNNHLVGNPAPPSYVPNLIADHGSRMNFWQRLQNTYRDIMGELFVHFKFLPEQEKLLKRIVPDAPNLSNILYNGSLMLLTSHLSLSDPVPLQQNVKEIGGYHVFPPKPLPKDIKKFLDEAEEGVVLFSMGSNLKSANFDAGKRRAILSAFSRIKQKVLWKFETDLPEKPSNVKIMKWLPQRDILAHPNVVAFITHGGLLGTIEAIYHGVPVLGLPVFWDQVKNIGEAAQKGSGVRLDLKNVNEESFNQALTEILNNPKYKQNAKERSRIMHDRPVKQIDEAVFWIEYVVRHRGAPHLRSVAVDLRWYQRYSVDIALFAVMVLVTIFLIIKYSFVILFSKKNHLQKKKRN